MTPVAVSLAQNSVLIARSMFAVDDFVFADFLVPVLTPWLCDKSINVIERRSLVVLHLAGHLFIHRRRKRQFEIKFLKTKNNKNFTLTWS